MNIFAIIKQNETQYNIRNFIEWIEDNSLRIFCKTAINPDNGEGETTLIINGINKENPLPICLTKLWKADIVFNFSTDKGWQTLKNITFNNCRIKAVTTDAWQQSATIILTGAGTDLHQQEEQMTSRFATRFTTAYDEPVTINLGGTLTNISTTPTANRRIYSNSAVATMVTSSPVLTTSNTEERMGWMTGEVIPARGQIRMNTETNVLEFWNDDRWDSFFLNADYIN